MSCPSDEVLIALLEHALVGEALRAIEVHLDQCEECRAMVGHLVALTDSLHAARTASRRA